MSVVFDVRTIIPVLLFVLTAVSAQGLPDGDGREAIQTMCSGCHAVNRIERSMGYSREHWLALMDTMIDLSDDPQKQSLMADYLAVNFPPNNRRAATLVNGDVRIKFTEWVVPTLGQRSRDPVEAPDGSIWWVGQWGNVMGRIDPTTGV